MADSRPSQAPPGRPGRRARRAAQVLRGLSALVVLLAMCVGIPIALVAFSSAALPSGPPGLLETIVRLSRPDDGTLFLAVLVIAGWVGWGTFATTVLLEITAQLRGVPAVRIRGLGAQQALAGGLVAAALTVFLLPSAASANDHSPGVATAPRPSAPAADTAPASFGVARTYGPFDRSASGRITPPRAHPPSSWQEGRVYEVRAGDTLWDIARRELGDSARWRDLATLNYGRVQPDGAHLDRSHVLRPGWRLMLPPIPQDGTDRNTARLDAGHPRQDVPADERGRGGGSTQDDAARPRDRNDREPRERVIRPGDTLSMIAEEELGDADRYPEIVRSSRDIVQPDGRHLADPDLIYPGWTVDVPARRGAAPRRHSPEQAQSHLASHTASAPAMHPAASPSETPERALPPPTTFTSGPGPGPEVGATGSRSGHVSASALPSTPDLADGDDDGLLDDIVDVRTAAGAGGLLAAGVLLLLGARRARQQRRRRPGERIRLPRGPVVGTEARLRAIADPAGVAHVDLALRALAAQQRAIGRALPGLRCVRLTTSHLELYFSEVARLPDPWIRASDPTVWAMSHDDLTAQPETDVRAPCPCLVTVGHDLEGAHVLVDLEQITALAVEGHPDDTLPVLAAMAVELATSPWADDLLVTLVGCLPELPAAVATGRLRHVQRIEALIAELEGRAHDVERVLRDAGVGSMSSARGTGVADDAWSPEIVILSDAVPEPLRNRLEQVLYRVPRVGLAAVTAGGAPLGEWRLLLSAGSTTARLEPTALTLQPQRLTGAEYAHVLELLRVADGDGVPGPAWAAALPDREPALADLPVPAVPDARDEPSAAGATARVDGTPEVSGIPQAEGGPDMTVGDLVRRPGRSPFVRLFGVVEVVGALGPEPVTLKDGRAVSSHLGRATALVAYLACRPDGATTEQVSEALSPVRRLSPNTLWSLASRTRKWLGSDDDGVPYLPRTAEAGSHRLHPGIRTDWSLYQELVGEDVTTTPLPRLVEALQLVRGRPFDGVSERHYNWAEPLREDMVAAVVDVVHEVVRRALLVPDAVTARRAAGVGRLVDPANERIWRDALRVEYVAGNRESQRRLVEQLYALAEDLETDLEPETEQLIAELEGTALSRAASR